MNLNKPSYQRQYLRNKNKKSYYKNRTKKLEKYREYYRTTGIQRKYGITPEQYNEMFESQKDCCAICGKHQSQEFRRLCIDHNHKTGRVRGLLCTVCNAKLGWFENRKDLIQEYLKD